MKYARFPTARLFEYSQLIQKSCSSESERKFLIGRLQSFVNGRRRGSLKLPARFKTLAIALSNLTKGQIRQMVWAVRPTGTFERPLPKWAFDSVKAVLPQTLWSTIDFSFDSVARRVDCHRLAKREWPRSARSLWPSSPSFTEMLGMSRCGESPSGLGKPNFGPKVHARKRDLDCPRFATRMLNNIIAIRPCVGTTEVSSVVPVPSRNVIPDSTL